MLFKNCIKGKKTACLKFMPYKSLGDTKTNWGTLLGIKIVEDRKQGYG